MNEHDLLRAVAEGRVKERLLRNAQGKMAQSFVAKVRKEHRATKIEPVTRSVRNLLRRNLVRLSNVDVLGSRTVELTERGERRIYGEET